MNAASERNPASRRAAQSGWKPRGARENDHDSEDGGSSDAKEVAAACSGEQDAFDRLVQRHQRRAVAVAYRLLGNIHDAADVAQNAFLRAYQSLSGLEDPSRFGPWLMRIVTNQALNFRRARRRTSALPLGDITEGQEQPGVGSAGSAALPGPVSDTQTAELQSAVLRAIEELPEKQRLAFTLFSLEGLPQKEVAEVMECSIELVKWNVFQARKTLRRLLADYLD
jgi:RNA polymerase sigma-70 factor (ECF subfamily)